MKKNAIGTIFRLLSIDGCCSQKCVCVCVCVCLLVLELCGGKLKALSSIELRKRVDLQQ